MRVWLLGGSVLLLLCTALEARAQSIGSYAPSAQDRMNKRNKGIGSIDEYVQALAGDSADERLQEVRNLGESKDPKAVEYLVQAVGDTDVRVKAKAIDMLGTMRATDSAPVLIQYLFMRTTDPQMKSLILARQRRETPARPITEFLQRDLDNRTKGRRSALGEIGSLDAEAALSTVAAMDQDRTIRRLANEALIKVQSRKAAVAGEAKQPAENFLHKDDEAPKGPE
jgi:HEAT repeat protein